MLCRTTGYYVPAVAVALVLANPATAQKTWTGATGLGWNSSANWSPIGVPTATDAAVFPAAAAQTTSIITSNSSIASLLFDAGALNYTLTSTSGVSLDSLTAITISATTTATQTINLANIGAGSLVFGAASQAIPLTITNNSFALAGSPPTLIIGPNTVIGTPGSAGVTFTGTGATTFSGAFADSSGPDNRVVGGLTKAGTGTLTLSGNGSNLSGGIRLNGGTLRLDYSMNAAVKFGASNTLISTGGDLVIVPSPSGFVIQNAAATTLNGGHTQVTFAGGGLVATLGIAVVTRSAGATIDFAGSPQPFGVTTTTGNTRGLLGTGPAFATIDGNRWAANDGSGTLQSVTGTSNSFSPGTNTEVISSGSLGASTTNSLRFSGNSLTMTLTGTLELQSGGVLVPAGTTGSLITGGTVTTTGGSGELLVHAYGPLQINSALVSSAGLTKTGPGQLTLFGNNTSLTGPITVNRGGLYVANIASVASSTGITFTDTVGRFDGSDYLVLDMAAGVNATLNKPITFSPGAAFNGAVYKYGTGALTLTATNTFGNLVVNAGTLGMAGLNDLQFGSVTVNNGALNIVGGGSVTNSFNANIGDVAGNVGTATVGGGGSGAAVWNNLFLRVGNAGTGSLTITGGGSVASTGFGVIGFSAGSTGTVAVGGGTGAATWTNSGELEVGLSGTATLTVTGGGTVTSTSNAFIAANPGSTGTVTVGGGTGAATWTNSGSLTVGSQGTGTLNIVGGGTVTNTGTAVIGNFAGSTGTVTVGGGIGAATWINSGTLYVGFAGTGTLNLLDGGLVSAPGLGGASAGSSINFDGGTLRITSTNTAVTAVNVLVRGGTIDLPTSGSTFAVISTLAGSGTLTKTGPGTLFINNSSTTFSGGVTVNAGRLDVPSDAALGAATLATGPLGTIRYTASALTSRTFNMAGTLEAPTGVTLTLNGATIGGGFLNSSGTGAFAVGAGGATIRNATVFAGTTINQTGGPLTADSLTFGGSHTLAAGQTFTGSNLNYTASAQVTVNGAANVQNLTSIGRITVTSGGTLTQTSPTTSAPLTFGGGSVSTVNGGGTLSWGGSGATQLGRLAGGLLINNGTVTGGRLVVDFGGVAKGTGSYSVNPLTINGGQYSPGSSPGRGNVEAFIADPGSSYTFEINDGTPGGAGPTTTSNIRGWDLTTVRDNTNPANSAFFADATTGQKFTINLVSLTAPSPPDVSGMMDNFNPNVSTQWLAFSVDPAATNPFPDGFDPNTFTINTSGFINPHPGSFALTRTGNDLFITYTPVPEPGLVLTIAAGGLAFVRLAQRRGRGRSTVSRSHSWQQRGW
jgi:fibronectin-binding autotransporter adhesin